MATRRDSEGVSKRHATEPDGIGSKNRVTGDDDVEGHGFRHASTTEPDGIGSKNRVTGDDDVEGHGFRHASTTEPDGIGSKNRVTGDDDDVEGHDFHLRSPSSRGE